MYIKKLNYKNEENIKKKKLSRFCFYNNLRKYVVEGSHNILVEMITKVFNLRFILSHFIWIHCARNSENLMQSAFTLMQKFNYKINFIMGNKNIIFSLLSDNVVYLYFMVLVLFRVRMS